MAQYSLQQAKEAERYRHEWRPFKKIGRTTGTVIYTVFVSGASYFGGILVSLIDNAKASGTPYILLVLGGFVLAGFMSLIAALIGIVVNNEEKRDRRTINIVRYAYKTINLSLTKFTHFVRCGRRRNPEQNIGSVLEFQTEVVREIYGLLEHEYGEGEFLQERIDFEVTFITKSYKDNELTIASWANKDGRAPRSLAARELNPLLYRDTEADKLYHDPNHSVRIIARTSAKEYKELYPGQKTRIKSSIIYPVFRDDSNLEGVIVAHCDKEDFFRDRERKFWSELLDIYAKRLALCRAVTTELVNSAGMDCEPY